MLSIIRQNIMESATRHFSRNGYAATSIQEIADDCGIAKGSLYKFFQSKEDLFIAFHDSQQMALNTKIESIRADATLSLREVFILETESHFEFFLNNKFIMHDIKELNVAKGHCTPNLLRFKANQMKYSKEGLIRFLGKEAISNIWDLIVIYNGIVREFIFLMIFENTPLNTREISIYIVDRIEEMAACIMQKKIQPILQSSILSNYMQWEMADKSISIEEYRTSLLEELLSSINELPITNFRKSELSDAINLIQGELANEFPKSVLINALLDFLEKEHELKDIIKQLKKYIFLKQDK